MATRRETKQERLLRLTERERPIWEAGALVGGVDEAGRGPLAGPVVAACVVMPPAPLLPDVNDSKKVAEKTRERLFDEICRTALAVGVGVATVEEIETLNIKQAARLAMKRAIEQAAPARVFVDAERDLDVEVPQEAIVHGDAVSYSIAAASIVAKVTRDHMMQELDAQYPQYGFAKHKGYGTAAHYEALRACGPCPAHRKLFIRSALSDK